MMSGQLETARHLVFYRYRASKCPDVHLSVSFGNLRECLIDNRDNFELFLPRLLPSRSGSLTRPLKNKVLQWNINELRSLMLLSAGREQDRVYQALVRIEYLFENRRIPPVCTRISHVKGIKPSIFF